MRIARASVIGLAGLVGAGVLAWPALGQTASHDDVYFKRQETDVELVAQDDEDDDDTVGKQQRDTRSRDVQSRGDQVSRDATRDGGTRSDWSADATNDVSRNEDSRNDVSRNEDSRADSRR